MDPRIKVALQIMDGTTSGELTVARVAQTLLGHSDLEETTLYLHLSQRHLNATASPLDALKLKDESPQDQ
jgi:integrase